MHMFAKFLHKIEQSGWKFSQRYAVDPSEEAEREEDQELERRRQQQLQRVVPTTPQPQAYPQVGPPPAPQTTEQQKSLSLEMARYIATNFHNQTEHQIAPFPEEWKKPENLQLFNKLLEHPRWVIFPWVDSWLSSQIAPTAAEEEPIVDEGKKQEAAEARPFQEAFVSQYGDWLKQQAHNDDNLVGRWVLRFLGPAQTPREFDNRSNALFKTEMGEDGRMPTILDAALTFPGFQNRLQQALQSKGYSLRDLYEAIVNNDMATKHAIDRDVMRGLMTSTHPGAEDGVQDILLSLLKDQSDPARFQASAALWKFYAGAFQWLAKKKEDKSPQAVSLEQDVSGKGDKSTGLGSLIDTGEAQEKRIGFEEDEGEQQILREQMAQKIQGLTLEKVNMLRDMAEYIDAIAEDYKEWATASGGAMAKKKTKGNLGEHKFNYNGREYVISRGEMMSAYMDAVASQVEDLLKPDNYKERSEMIRRYNKGKGHGEQIAEETPEEAEARKMIEQSLTGKALWQKGHASIGVSLVGTQRGGDLGYEFDLSKLVNASALKKHFGIRSQIVEATKTAIRQMGINEQDSNRPDLPVDKIKQAVTTSLSGAIDPGYLASKLDERYIRSAVGMKSGERAVIKAASENDDVAVIIRQSLMHGWTKTWDYIFSALNAGRFSPEMVRMFVDTVGVHKNFMYPITKDVHQQLRAVSPEWYKMTEEDVADKMIPPVGPGASHKEKREREKKHFALKKMLRGRANRQIIKKVWEELYHRPAEQIPPEVDEWLKYREQAKDRWGARYPFEERYNALSAKNPVMFPPIKKKLSHYMLGRTIFAQHRARIASLISLRNNLSKFAAKNVLNRLISGAVEKAGESLVASLVVFD